MGKVLKQKYVRNTLNKGQITVLELVYKYRFVSRQLLAVSVGVKPENGLYEKLEILVAHGYLGKRLEKRLTLDNVPAAYYITPQGLKYLQSVPGHKYISQQAFQESYRDKSIVGNRFIAQTLNVYRLTQSLQTQYPDLKVFTQRDLSQYSYFPKRLPDAFLSLRSNNPNQPHRFFFDIVKDRQPRGDLIKKLISYNEFFDDGGWDETGSDMPVLLLLCEWSPSEHSAQRSSRLLLSKLESGLGVYTTTAQALESNVVDKEIWTDINDINELLGLDAISVNP
jgi:hypothetical protein